MQKHSFNVEPLPTDSKSAKLWLRGKISCETEMYIYIVSLIDWSTYES